MYSHAIKIIKSFKKHGLKVMTIGGTALIVLSLIVIIPTLYFRYSHQGTVSLAAVMPQVKNIVAPQPGIPRISGQPISVSVPSVWINNVPVVDGVYDAATGDWNVGLSQAQFIPQTALPNNIQGDTYIYGHYRPAVFAYLHHVVAGSSATVTTANGYLFTYQYVGTYAIAPSDSSVLAYTGVGPPILTLQTCSGDFFQNRQLYIFDYVSYQKL